VLSHEANTFIQAVPVMLAWQGGGVVHSFRHTFMSSGIQIRRLPLVFPISSRLRQEASEPSFSDKKTSSILSSPSLHHSLFSLITGHCFISVSCHPSPGWEWGRGLQALTEQLCYGSNFWIYKRFCPVTDPDCGNLTLGPDCGSSDCDPD
jgi:hypothetical protein